MDEWIDSWLAVALVVNEAGNANANVVAFLL